MVLSISGVVLLGIICFLFFKKDGMKATHAIVCALFGFFLAGFRHRPQHHGEYGEPREPARRDQALDRRDRTVPHHPQLQETTVARRPLPRILSSGTASLARGREFARTAADSATDVLHPLLTIGRGLRVLAVAGRRKWAATPKDKRGPALFLGAAVVLAVALVPYGPLVALITLMAAAAWQGRDRTPVRTGPSDAETERLGSLYEALVPYFSIPEDPSPLFAHGGDWDEAFSGYEFDEAGRVTRLRIRYPAYFTDGEAASRARIEALLHAKSGRGREYHFDWDEEGNQLDLRVLAALPTGIAAQPFVTSPGETVLGFTDPAGVQRTLPVLEGDEPRDVPPVIWRTGPAPPNRTCWPSASPAAAPPPCCARSPSRHCGTAAT